MSGDRLSQTVLNPTCTSRDRDDLHLLLRADRCVLLSMVPTDPAIDPAAATGLPFAAWEWSRLTGDLAHGMGVVAGILDGPRSLFERVRQDELPRIGREIARWLGSTDSDLRIDLPLECDSKPVELSHWVRLDLTATRDRDGGPARIDGFLRDITEQKQSQLDLEESQQWLRLLMNSSAAGVVILGADGRILMLNPTAIRLLGRPEGLLTDTHWNDLPWKADDPLARFDPTLSTRRNIQDALLLPDGTTVVLGMNAVPMKSPAGGVTGMIVSLTDRTSQALAEEALRASQTNLNGIVGTTAEGILLVDAAGTVTFANSSAEQLFGLPSVALLERHWTGLRWGPADRPGEEVFQSEEIETWLFERRESLCDLVWVIPGIDAPDRLVLVRFTPLDSADPCGDGDSVVRGMVVTFGDHTARLRAQEELRASESRFRALIENNPDPILLLSPQGEVKYATPSLPGWSAPAVGSAVSELLAADDRGAFARRLAAAAESDAPIDTFEVRTAPPEGRGEGCGEIVEVHLHSRLHDPAVAAVVANLRIITKRREAEERQKASERKYRLLFENNLAGVCRSTLDGRYVDCNGAYARIYGLADVAEVMRGNALDRYAHPDQRGAKLKLLRESGGRLSNHIAAGRHADGREILLLENITLATDESGREVVEGVVIDITPLHEAREDLARQNGILLSLIESIPDNLFFKDVRGRYLGCNSAFESWMGLKRDEILGRTSSDLVTDPEALRRCLEEDETAMRTLVPLRLEKRCVRADGRDCLVELVLSPMFDDRKRFLGIVGVGRDVTDQREIARRMGESARMESVGCLAAGIAHDFNNLLTVLMGNLGLVSLVPQSSPEYRTLVGDCEQAVARADSLTRQLLNYSRQTPMKPTKLAVGPIVEETLSLLRRTINRGIALVADTPADLWPVHGDRSQIGQILMNLCLNARDAMPGGGRLHIATYNRTRAEAGDGVAAGQYVLLEVSDDGSGIPGDVRAHIFEPFYTTKPVGQGSGLGLAVVSGLVQQHNGSVECVGGPDDRGTTFRVWLPRFRGDGPENLTPAPASA